MSTVAFEGEYFSICFDSNNTEFVYARENEVLIVPLTAEEKVLLIIEPSAAFGEQTLILPGGVIGQGEEQIETAHRELQEEVGYAPHRLDFLGELRPFSKYLTTRSFIYLARDLIVSQITGDEPYLIQIESVALSDFEALIAEGRLLDARAIAALYLTRTFLTKSKGVS